ncbi:MAG: transcription antitermination factor NusB [Lachnospiraceae bacterium]|nr:transcription antitermination factor NusB [Lachnospiraceae bacterium]
MTRHEMRECIFCLLFQNEFYKAEEFEEQRDNFLKEKSLSEKNEEEILDKLKGLIEKLPAIDEKIAANAKGWQIDRIAKAELAILRLALYEALYDDTIPVGVAINEAVELAKQYGDENGASFVNGILGKVVNE